MGFLIASSLALFVSTPKAIVVPVGPPANGQALTGNGSDGTVARWSSYYGQPAVVNSNYMTESATGVTLTGTTAVGAATFTPNLSSFTVSNATGAMTATTLGQCVSVSSVSLSPPSYVSTVWVSFSGASTMSVVGSTATLGVMVDGAFAKIGGTNGVLETTTKGIISVAVNNTAASQIGQDINMSFGPLPIVVTAGAQHQFCLTADVTSGVLTLDTLNSIPQFTVAYYP